MSSVPLYFGAAGVTIKHSGLISTALDGLVTGKLTWQTPQNTKFSLQPRVGDLHPLQPGITIEKVTLRMAPGIWLWDCDYAGADEKVKPVYELQIGTGTVPIETHPEFRKFAGTPARPLNGAIFVDEKGNPTRNNRRARFEKFSLFDGRGAANLFAGVDSFFDAINITWTKRYTRNSIPADRQLVGKIDKPEGGPPRFGDSKSVRNWLYMGLNATSRGSGYQLRKVWRLSAIGGWIEPIYGS